MVLEISNWIPAISTTSLLALAMWLFRSLISTRLTKSVENEFNTKIENLRSDLRQKETSIEALRSGAMSGLLGRQVSLYERQLAAIDQVWEAVSVLEKAKHISKLIAITKYEESAEEAAKNPQFRQIFEIMGGGFDVKSIKLDSASKARPFLTPLAWAYYNAYQSIITLNILKFEFLKIGIETPSKFIDSESVTKLVKIVLPHQSDYIDKHGSSVTHYLLDEIENLLLLELQNIQKGDAIDQENAKRAAEILKASNELMETISDETQKA
jgi:hypothetical protein